MNKKLSVFLLALIMVLSTCAFLFFAEKKQGYHCDEVWSHGLSNTTFHYPLHDADGKICLNTPEDIEAYMTVPEDGAFDYAGVLKNQRDDVHPPFFYAIVHTLASFTPGHRSDYHVIAPNIAFTLGTMVFLYLIAMRVLKKRSLAVLTVFLYAFSAHCINIVTYMRMYAMLTFFTTVSTYIHLRLSENDYRMTGKMTAALCVVTFLGALTQYYFLVFAAALAVWAITDAVRRCRSDAWKKYISAMCVTAAVYGVLWWPAFVHILSPGRGHEAFGNFVISPFVKNVLNNLDILRTGSGDILSSIILFVLPLCFIVAAAKNKLVRKNLEKHRNVIAIAFVALLYFFIITKVAPYQKDRYISPIFPLFVVVGVFLTKNTINGLFGKFRKVRMIACALILILTFAGVGISAYDSLCVEGKSTNELNYLYRVPAENRAVFNEYGGKKCVRIYDYEWEMLRNLPDYKNFSETVFVMPEELPEIKEMAFLDGENEFILYVSSYSDSKKILEELKNEFGFEYNEFLAESEHRNYAKIYLVSKTDTGENVR